MSKLAELVADVRAEITDCPAPTVLAALVKAARVFFPKTGLWRYTLKFTVPAGVVKRDISGRVGGRVEYVRNAISDPSGLSFEQSGDIFELSSAQGQDVRVELEVVVGIVDQTTDIPVRVFADSREALVDGALMFLFKQNKGWFSPQLSAAHEADFRKAMGRARIMADGGVAQVREAYGRLLG